MFFQNSKIIEPQKQMMSFSGIWPKKDPSILYRATTTTSYLLGFALTVTMLIQSAWSLGDFAKLSEILYMAATMMSFMIKLTSFMVNQKYFFELENQIADPDLQVDSQDSDEHLRGAWRISWGLTNLYKYVCVMTCVSYAFFPLLEDEPLPFPFPFFNSGKSRYPMFLFQLVAINFSGWNNACLDTITTGFMLISGAQLEILKNKIVQVINSGGSVTEEKLRECCVRHAKVIEFTKNIENLFSVGLLAQFCSSIVCICNTGFHFMLISWRSAQFVNLALYFVAMSSQLSMYCWFGNEIILKSRELGQACYNSDWYRLSPKLNKYVFLIMERSKRPLAISAYKFANLSLTSFTTIIHWSYSYYALLRRLYADRV